MHAFAADRLVPLAIVTSSGGLRWPDRRRRLARLCGFFKGHRYCQVASGRTIQALRMIAAVLEVEDELLFVPAHPHPLHILRESGFLFLKQDLRRGQPVQGLMAAQVVVLVDPDANLGREFRKG